jgi:histidine triad (HIT) family protein
MTTLAVVILTHPAPTNHASKMPPQYTPPMAETIFSKILRGEIPCHKVYEDAHVLAFLDVFPLSRGHTLVIPKEPAETLDALSDDASAAIGRVLPRIARAVLRATGANAYNILQNNGTLAHQAVFHVHFHIIPKFDNGDGLGIGWRAGKLDPTAGAELAKKITGTLT